MLLDLVYYDNFFLRKKAHPIEKITDEIKQLAKDMIETMDAKNMDPLRLWFASHVLS